MITKIKNAVLITDTLIKDQFLYIEDNRIKAITAEELPHDAVIDAEGLFASPGFIDIHTHGGGGHDFTDGDVEDILAAAMTHAKHGTTTIYPTCPTASFEGILRFVENVKTAMEKNAPGLPFIAGSHLEGPYFSQSMRGAQNPDFIKNPRPEEYTRWVEAGEGTVSRISFAPELDGAEELCEYLTEKGAVAAYAHTEAIYEEIKPVIDKGCKLATHLYSGMNMVTRRGCYRKLGAVETSYLEPDVTVEVIADGCHLPAELLRLIYQIKGADRICMVTDSMSAACMGEGPAELGGMECFVKDGVAFLKDMTAFAGSVATTDRLMRVMHKQVGLPLTECIKMMCKTPARVMKLSDRGALKEGYVADLVFFDEDIHVKKVILQGKELPTN